MNNIQNEGLLNPKPGDPNGYVTKDGMWAAVPWGEEICDSPQWAADSHCQ